VISGLLTMSLLAGGVVYASDNADAYDEIEPFCEQSDISSEIDLEDFCNDLERLRDPEIAASVSYCPRGRNPGSLHNPCIVMLD